MDNILLTLARTILNGVLDEINKQLSTLETQVINVMQGFIKDVVNGMWQGPDADKFVAALNDVLPKVQDISQRTTAFSSGISNAADHITQADQNAQQQVADLVGQFAKIY